MKNSVFTARAAGALLISIAATPLALAGRDISSVNGSVDTTAGQTYDSLTTVNGDVRVSRGVSAGVAKTVNGDVTLEDDAKVGRATTVNGSLTLRDGASVTNEATTVNGSIDVGNKARVGGNVTTVSGGIDLTGAEVGGSIETRNGDIRLRDGSRVHGGITVRKKTDHGWFGDRDDDRPLKVSICATCVVDGDLRFERAVELRVEPGAKIGQVIGDKVKRL
ncbi:MAG TPA: hypothetical protein VMF52_17510 [Steroidobacteraceae bacterium]|nr:hypothetical protein [Steroidobacteraceae bacterium]